MFYQSISSVDTIGYPSSRCSNGAFSKSSAPGIEDMADDSRKTMGKPWENGGLMGYEWDDTLYPLVM